MACAIGVRTSLMSVLSQTPSLREIHAHKKHLTWGDIPPIYQMVYTSISDIDSILTHGFDSAYKQLLDRGNWNLSLLQGYRDDRGKVHVKHKPQICLRHVMTEKHYELHCYPLMIDEYLNHPLLNDPNCPFINWQPESMRMLFRLSSLIPFLSYCLQKGDEADLHLVKFAYRKVEQLIAHLKESFDIVEIKGVNIAEFCQELTVRQNELRETDANSSQQLKDIE